MNRRERGIRQCTSISVVLGTVFCVNTTAAAPVFVFPVRVLVLAEPILVSQVVAENMEGVVLAL